MLGLRENEPYMCPMGEGGLMYWYNPKTIALCSDIGPMLLATSGGGMSSGVRKLLRRAMLLRAETSEGWSNFIDYRFRSTEERSIPETDEEALTLLDGDPDSEAFVMEYEKLRGAGMDIEQAFIIHRPHVPVEAPALPATQLNSTEA
jgi:hypothetical protein